MPTVARQDIFYGVEPERWPKPSLVRFGYMTRRRVHLRHIADPLSPRVRRCEQPMAVRVTAGEYDLPHHLAVEYDAHLLTRQVEPPVRLADAEHPPQRGISGARISGSS